MQEFAVPVQSVAPKVTPFKAVVGLAQISQSMDVQMCLMMKEDDASYKEVTPYVKCYDFLVDSYSASKEGHNFSIYGFSWKGKERTPDLENVNLNIRFPSKEVKETFKANLHFLHEIEAKNNIPLTVFYDTGDNTGIAIGHKEWLQNCIKLRLYLFLFRGFSYKFTTSDWITELGANGSSDAEYVRNLPRPSWDRILNDLTSIHTDFFCGLSFSKDGTGGVHHNSGFFSTFSYHTEMNPDTIKKGKHWQVMKERGFALFTN